MNSIAWIVILIAVALLTEGPVVAGETAEEFALIASLAFVDYNQSVDMFYTQTGYHEVNPILGPSPSREELILFGAVGLGVSYIAAMTLPNAWRQVVVDSIISTERLNIEDNRTVYEGWNVDGPPLRGRIMHGIPIMVTIRM